MRRSRIEKIKNGKAEKKRGFFWLLYLVIGLVVFSLAVFFVKLLLLPKYYFVDNAKETTDIYIVDTEQDKYTRLLIPGATEVSSACSYGKYKIGNLWKMVSKDSDCHHLMTTTIVKNFGFPVYLWKDGKDTNLNLLQVTKFYMVRSKFVDVNLNKYQFLKPSEFKDGSSGYVVSSKSPEDILVYFVDNQAGDIHDIELSDLTGNIDTLEQLEQLFSVFGLKIKDYKKGYDENLDCQVYGGNQKLVKLFSKILLCDVVNEQTVQFGLRVGSLFARRF